MKDSRISKFWFSCKAGRRGHKKYPFHSVVFPESITIDIRLAYSEVIRAKSAYTLLEHQLDECPKNTPFILVIVLRR